MNEQYNIANITWFHLMRRECFRKQLLKLEPKTSQFEIKHFLHVSQGSSKQGRYAIIVSLSRWVKFTCNIQNVTSVNILEKPNNSDGLIPD